MICYTSGQNKRTLNKYFTFWKEARLYFYENTSEFSLKCAQKLSQFHFIVQWLIKRNLGKIILRPQLENDQRKYRQLSHEQ